jgi:hypothetical protein
VLGQVQNEEINLVKTGGDSNKGTENTDPLLSGNQNICVVTKFLKKNFAAAPVSKIYIFHLLNSLPETFNYNSIVVFKFHLMSQPEETVIFTICTSNSLTV